MLYEGSLTAIAVASAFAWPRLANKWFSRVERVFGQLARRKGLAVTSVVFATLLVRIAIISLRPIPLPFLPDDFSNLLACNTFLQGRLANPTPVMWTHFETVHVDMKPTYASMYFPAQGLMMAAGKVLFGNPWLGILCTSGLMCGAICWMLQAWLPPGWALLGGFIAMVRLGLFSYWVNTYTGAGLVAGLGGALVLGALPRLTRTVRFRYGMLMAIGIVLLVLSRPYEGLLLCLPVTFFLGRWALFGKNRPDRAVLLRRAGMPLLLIAAGIAWLGYYDYRVFGNATTLPYTINRATYAMAPYFVWQSAPGTDISSRRDTTVLLRKRNEGVQERPFLVSVGNRSFGEDFSGCAVFCRHRPEFTANNDTACPSRPPGPLLGRLRSLSRGGDAHRDISNSSLRRPIHRGILCNWLTGHASSSVLEPRKQTRRQNPGAADSDSLYGTGGRAGFCRATRVQG